RRASLRSKHVNQVDARGYSILELLVAMGIMLSGLAATLTIVSALQTGFGIESERADGQQRLRVAVNALSQDLLLAGAGPHQGARAGPLAFSIAAVFPFRQGAARA